MPSCPGCQATFTQRTLSKWGGLCGRCRRRAQAAAPADPEGPAVPALDPPAPAQAPAGRSPASTAPCRTCRKLFTPGTLKRNFGRCRRCLLAAPGPAGPGKEEAPPGGLLFELRRVVPVDLAYIVAEYLLASAADAASLLRLASGADVTRITGAASRLNPECLNNLALAALLSGDVALMTPWAEPGRRWVAEENRGPILASLCAHGHAKGLAWFLGAFPGDRPSPELLVLACQNGQLEVAQWLLESKTWKSRPSAPVQRRALKGACTNGHSEVVRWMFRYRSWRSSDILVAVKAAGLGGHNALARWLANEANPKADDPKLYEKLLETLRDEGRLDLVLELRDLEPETERLDPEPN